MTKIEIRQSALSKWQKTLSRGKCVTKRHHSKVLQSLQHFTVQVVYNLPLSKVCRCIHGKILSSVTSMNIVQHILKDSITYSKQLRRLWTRTREVIGFTCSIMKSCVPAKQKEQLCVLSTNSFIKITFSAIKDQKMCKRVMEVMGRFGRPSGRQQTSEQWLYHRALIHGSSVGRTCPSQTSDSLFNMFSQEHNTVSSMKTEK